MKNLTLKDVITYVFAALAFYIVIYYMFGPSEGYLHSDCVDTMTWSTGTIESGKLFSDTFYYPYLLPFGGTFLFYPFELLFGFTMLAQRLSMLTFMLMFAGATFFVAIQMNWNKRWALIAVSIQLITLSSSRKLRELFWEHIIHYSLGAFLALVLLGLTFAFMKYFTENKYTLKKIPVNKGKNKKAVIFFVLLALWSFFSAFDGLTTLTLSTIPVLGALFLETLFDYKNKFFSKTNKDLIFSFLIIMVTTVGGAIVLNTLTKDIATDYGNTYSVITGGSDWSPNAQKFLEHWTTLLGADFKVNAAITEKENILAAIKMAASLILFLTPLYALFIYEKLNRNEKVYVLFHWLMTGFILYGYVFGRLSTANWRLSPIICSAVVVCVLVWRYIWLNAVSKRIAGLWASLIVLGCFVTVSQILQMPFDYGFDNAHHKAIEVLKKYDLDYGYATYWNANILTLLSDSEVKVRDVNFDNGEYKNGWLNCDRQWYKTQPGRDKYFILFAEHEYNGKVEENHPILEDTVEVIHENGWYILIKDKNIF